MSVLTIREAYDPPIRGAERPGVGVGAARVGIVQSDTATIALVVVGALLGAGLGFALGTGEGYTGGAAVPFAHGIKPAIYGAGIGGAVGFAAAIIF